METLTAVVAAVTIIAGAPATLRLEPIDQGHQRPDFRAFRSRLLQTIATRNVAALLSIVHPDIKTTLGDDNGIDAFKRLWRLDQRDSELWRELDAVLALGGTFEGPDAFVAPYVFSRWPDNVDAFDHVAVTGSNVRVRSAPAPQATVLTALSFAVLRLGGDRGYPQRPWTAVVLPDGRSGFVAAELVRSPIDYRAYFVCAHGEWQMTMFIAGD